ncbi:MAG: ABC transporter permease [Acidobacteriota bacterium]|nr:ABC transporter permease [Acidobacteriota bacterium]
MVTRPEVVLKEAGLALRSLRRERAFTLLSVVLLALGIGLASAVFTLLWQAIYAQLPVPEPAQIFTLKTNVTHNGRSDSDAGALTFSEPTYRFLAQNFKPEMIARHGEMVNIEAPDSSNHVLADFVTGNFFGVLGVKPAIGRTLQAHNDTLSGDRFTAMLSYDFWQETYGGQMSAWNSTVRVNGVPFRVIGVAPPGFRGLIAGQAPKLYLPVAAFADVNPGWHSTKDWSVRWLNPFMRLPAGASSRAVEAQLQPVYGAAVRLELASEGMQSPAYLKELSHERLSIIPASQGAHAQLDNWGEPLRIPQWLTLAVLLLAATNVAGLMVVRAVKQRQETLIRYALGATRVAVMRLHFLQTVMLSIVGGLLGLWIARWGAQLLVHMARMDRGGAFTSHLSGRALALHWMAVLAVGLLVGIIPAWQSARVALAAGLTEGALTHSAARSQALARRSLAAAQIALSLLLAIAAGLFAKALHTLVSVPVGFSPNHLTIFSIDAKLAHSTLSSTEALWERIEHRLKETPGVRAVSYGTGGPFPQGADVAIVSPGSHATPTGNYESVVRNIVGPQYFKTLGIPVLAGREIDERDRPNMQAVIVINQALARKLFGSANPLGQTVTMFDGLDPNWLATVVGVIADHRQSWKRANGSLVYTAAQQTKRETEITYYVRTASGYLSEKTIRRIVHREAPGISSYDVATMPSRMAEFASGERAMAVLVSTFAVLALAIAAVGIYGLISYSASMRTVEFGVRIAVGAQPSDIMRLVLKEAGIILAGGVVLCVPLACFALAISRHQLTGISYGHPAIYAAALLLVILCTLAGAAVPARRAARMSVHGALRQQ